MPEVQLHHIEVTDTSVKLIWFANLRLAYPATYTFFLTSTHGWKLTIEVDRASNDLVVKNLAPNRTYKIEMLQHVGSCQRVSLIGSINVTTLSTREENDTTRNCIIYLSIISTVMILLTGIAAMKKVIAYTNMNTGNRLDHSISEQRLLGKDNSDTMEEHVYTITGHHRIVT